MRIRLLGPVEVESAGRKLDIGPRQRRTVLAALAVDAGTPVSIDALAERVWGGSAPQAPRSALYAHLTRLRHVLATAARDDGEPIALRRESDGYVLDVDRRRVDLHRLTELVDSGRVAPPDEVGDRVAALREAMDLWRGRPLSTVASFWADRTRQSIESQLINVARDWAAEELRLGNAQVVADRLARVTQIYPLAEPLVALYMRALCLLGRTSEALQCYAQARNRIAEQLGTEPGPELRRLHVAVLRGEFDGTMLANQVTVSPAHPPRQLPGDIVRLPVHSVQLCRILDAFASDADPAPAVAVWGGIGTGKSALAIHAAHQLAERYPDGQLYLDLHGCQADVAPLTPAEVLGRLLRTLGVAGPAIPTPVDEAAALLRSLVAGRRLLFVLDNAADARQVMPLLPAASGCGTIVTSRQPLASLTDLRSIGIGPLAEAEALSLLRHWIGAERVAAEPHEAAAIAYWCEYLPMALRVAAARLVLRPGWPLAELRTRLADERRRLDTLELDGTGVRASIAGSHARLLHSTDATEQASARAFVTLGSNGCTRFTLADAARVLSAAEPSVEPLLERLVDAQLLETSTPGVYRMGALLRLYAREQQRDGRA